MIERYHDLRPGGLLYECLYSWLPGQFNLFVAGEFIFRTFTKTDHLEL